MSLVSDFDYVLPPELIAQEARPRGTSRLLVVDRGTGQWRESVIADLPQLLAPGDIVVANDTRVFPARLIGRREPSGGAVECLLVAPVEHDRWEALVHPGQKLKPRARMIFEDAARAPGVRITGEILERQFFGRRLVHLQSSGAPHLEGAIDALGHVPLPPYIRRADRPHDRERYQTVYSRVRGSVAAPTAGLHFTPAIVDALGARGIRWATLTLHVGYGTFQPVRAERVEEHQMAAEHYGIADETAEAIARARAKGRRVVAVGTTSCRALESAATAEGTVRAGAGDTNLFIHPGHRFRAVDALLTNFHLPRSSLLMLVAAFAGPDLTRAVYRHAVERGFMFYSYGDAMLIV